MKKTITKVLMIACFASSAFAQTPQFNWATTHGSNTGSDTGNSIISDAQGNSYVTGSFMGTADFDPTAGTQQLTSNGNSDVFVMKLDNMGNLVWVKQIGGTGWDNALVIEKDQAGNLFIGGYFEATADFDPGMGTDNKTSNGLRDMFITKLDADGNLIWAHTLGSTAQDILNDAHVDASGNIFLTGEYGGTMDFDPTAGYTSLSCQGTDAFVLKLTNNGAFNWVRKIGGNGNDAGYSVEVDNMGLIVVTGTFNATVDFDNTMGTFNISPSGIIDMFLLKLSPVGDHIWAGSCGGSMSEVYPRSVTIGDNNDIYVCGYYSGYIDINPGASSTYVSSNGSMDAFIMKVDISGALTWGQSFGSSGPESAVDIQFNSGKVYMIGAFANTVDFDASAGVSNVSTSGGFSTDVYVLSLSAQGAFNYVMNFGGDYMDNGNALSFSTNGELFLTGNHINNVDMDPGTGVSMINSPETATNNIYVSKFTTCAPTSGTDIQNACFEYTWIDGNTYTANNNTATYTLTNASGCDSVVTLNLTITPMPDLTISASGNTLTVAASGLQYQWIDCNNGNADIPNATGQTFTPTMNGSYAVTVIDGNCSETSNCFTINTIGLQEESIANIQLYPNPTTGIIHLSKEADLRIVTMNGNEVLNVEQVKMLDLQNLSKGLYICELLSNGNVILRQRIVLQ